MAPSADDVKALFNSFYGSGSFNTKLFENSLAAEHSLSVAGHDFVCAGGDQDVKDFATDVSGPIMKAIDPSKSVRYQVVSVITSSDSPLVAVEARTTATTKNGKPWVNEAVSIVKFNAEGKIVSMKLYMDTQHVHEHVVAHS